MRLSDVRLSVLDTAPIVEGSTARDALHNTVDLARLADELGYHRYWVPEHHGMRGVASTDPAVLATRLADATRNLRVGAGGVLLPNHPPLLVAERFGMVQALHPGRVDLGLGRAPGGPPAAAGAIRPEVERAAASFAEQVRELLGYFDPPEDWTVRAVSARGNQPPVWILGSSPNSAELAGALGLPYAFAHHLQPGNTAEALRTYRAHFQPAAQLSAPQTLVSVSLVAADTDEDAHWLAGSEQLKTISRRYGRRILLPPPEDAAAYPYDEADRDALAARSESVLVGSPETLTARLDALLAATGTGELMVRTLVHDHAARRRSYELLSRIVG